VLKWTLVCCGLLLWVTTKVPDREAVWWMAWSGVYAVTALLVQLFSRHLERLLEAHRAAEERQRGAIVAERTRFAREIHDTLAHGFTGIMMQLNAAGQRIEADPARAREHLEKARELARQSLEEARRSVSALQPGPLANGDLLSAIEQLGLQTTSASGIQLHTRLEGQPYSLSEECEAQLLRIAQEALTNAVRHGGPARIEVRLCYQPRSVVLEVCDDGRGMSGGERTGFGLTNMSERARQIGAAFTIRSEAGQGTRIVTTVPTA
jgi:signal transduction histidine kinase